MRRTRPDRTQIIKYPQDSLRKAITAFGTPSKRRKTGVHYVVHTGGVEMGIPKRQNINMLCQPSARDKYDMLV